MLTSCVLFFFFKQKTAYEMRISDWSSDVCSSDLPSYRAGSMTKTIDLAASVRSIPDYPKPGIIFRDITTLLGDATAFRQAVDELVRPYAGTGVDKIAGVEARGFILGGALAHQLSAGFVPIRKKGKIGRAHV